LSAPGIDVLLEHHRERKCVAICPMRGTLALLEAAGPFERADNNAFSYTSTSGSMVST
jgi:hypothetical protein